MKSYAIAEGLRGVELEKRLAALRDAGVHSVQLRSKDLTDAERLRLAVRFRAILGPSVRLLVNGRFDLAAAAGADGVHLPSDGLPAALIRERFPRMIIGRSCHSVADCEAAAEEGCDYALLGPVFPPRSKTGEGRVGMAELARAATLGIDVYALGGLSMANLPRLAGVPLAGVAGISLFMTDEPLAQIVETVRAL